MLPLILVIVGIAMILPACRHEIPAWRIKYKPEEVLYIAMMFVGIAMVIAGIILAIIAWI